MKVYTELFIYPRMEIVNNAIIYKYSSIIILFRYLSFPGAESFFFDIFSASLFILLRFAQVADADVRELAKSNIILQLVSLIQFILAVQFLTEIQYFTTHT